MDANHPKRRKDKYNPYTIYQTKQGDCYISFVYMPQKNIRQSKIPIALSGHLDDYPSVKNIMLHLDNDRPGRLASEAICTVTSTDYRVYNAPPPSEKDCNDYLLFRLGEKVETQERSAVR